MIETNKPVRVRFAPSPTGHMHLGSARTKLDNFVEKACMRRPRSMPAAALARHPPESRQKPSMKSMTYPSSSRDPERQHAASQAGARCGVPSTRMSASSKSPSCLSTVMTTDGAAGTSILPLLSSSRPLPGISSEFTHI